jgi:hypothetical protein
MLIVAYIKKKSCKNIKLKSNAGIRYY